jgi:hypothetical protein
VVILFVIEPNVHKISILSFIFILILGYFLSFVSHKHSDNQSDGNTEIHSDKYAQNFLIIDDDFSVELHQTKAVLKAIAKESKEDGNTAIGSDVILGVLAAGSRVGVMGLWLNIQSDVGGKVSIHQCFIFKDRLSSKDYARLSRLIKLLT